MKYIALTQGKYAIVDDNLYDWLNQWKWNASFLHNDYYAMRQEMVDGKRKTIYMARLILDAKEGELVDHINRITLDNRKDNLRIVTHRENNRNSRPKGGTSKYKGVHFEKFTGKWRASITVNRKEYKLGRFKSEVEAAKAYNEAAYIHYGCYAYLNDLGEAS